MKFINFHEHQCTRLFRRVIICKLEDINFRLFFPSPSPKECTYKFVSFPSLGIAFFDLNSGTLKWGETNEDEQYRSLEFIKFQFNPTFILVSSKSDTKDIEAIKRPSKTLLTLTSLVIDSETEFQVKIIKQSEFGLEICKKRVELLKKLLNESENDIFDPNDPQNEKPEMIKATGALISYIQNNRLEFGEINGEQVLACIKKLETVSFEGFLSLDLNSYFSLSIFKVEKHPCLSMNIGLSKEGLSLFGILNKTVSPSGKDLMKKWFMQPIRDLEMIKTRLDLVEIFSNVENKVLTNIRKELRHVKRVDRVLNKISDGKGSQSDWIGLNQTLTAIQNIFNILNPIREYFTNLPFFSVKLPDSIAEMAIELPSILDFKLFRSFSNIVICRGVDEELDELRSIYNGFESFLQIVSEKEKENFDMLTNLAAVYFPQIGYVVSIKISEFHYQLDEITGLQHVFSSQDEHFFKTQLMEDLDANFGDIVTDINQKESQILRRLEVKVLHLASDFEVIIPFLSQLDCIISFSLASMEGNFTRPTLTDENVLEIQNGRNPLSELCTSTFIPNDTKIKEQRVNLITGPNSSGKSVYLKQIGLIVFMAHLGCFVPADKAVIGLVDKIFTRICSHESVNINASSFALDLMQMNNMINTSTNKSLCLIDEFGKGTLSLDGLTLLSSCLQHFIDLKMESPKVFCTTHYTELLENRLIDVSSPHFAFWTMNVLIEDKSNKVTVENLVFLFKLVKGKITPSYGIICAESAGVPIQILDRAKEISRKIKHGEVIERIKNESLIQQEIKCEKVLESFEMLDLNSSLDVKDFMMWLEKIETLK